MEERICKEMKKEEKYCNIRQKYKRKIGGIARKMNFEDMGGVSAGDSW